MHLMAKNKKAAKAASVDKKIIRQSAKEMFENHKGGIIAIAVLAVVIIALIIAVAWASSDSNQYKLFNQFVPSQLTDDATGITFYAEKNPDFVYDAETSNVINSLKYYYYPGGDTSHEKMYLSNGTYYSEEKGSVHVDVGFVLAGLKNINKLTTGLKIGAGILAAVVVAVLIWLYYLSYKKQEQAEKEKIRKRFNQNQKPKEIKGKSNK